MNTPSRIRDRQFSVYLFEEEMAVLEAKKDEANMTKSEYIRNMILFGAAHERTNFAKEYSEKMIYEINRIGNNLNQIAYRANSSKNVDQHDFITMYDNYVQLLSAYDNFVRGNLEKCRA